MSVVLTRTVRLRIGAGSAKPGPAIGQALGPLGLNMAEFCKQFNDQTKDFEKDVPVPVTLAGSTNSCRYYLMFHLFNLFYIVSFSIFQ